MVTKIVSFFIAGGLQVLLGLPLVSSASHCHLKITSPFIAGGNEYSILTEEDLARAKRHLTPGEGPGFAMLNTSAIIQLPKGLAPTMAHLIQDPGVWGNQELLYIPSEIEGFKFTWELDEKIPIGAASWENFVVKSSGELLTIAKRVVPKAVADQLQVEKAFFRYNGQSENLGKKPHCDGFPLVSVTFLDDLEDTEGTIVYPFAKNAQEAQISGKLRLKRGHTVFFYGYNLVNKIHSPLLQGMKLTKPIWHSSGKGARMVFIQAYNLKKAKN